MTPAARRAFLFMAWSWALVSLFGALSLVFIITAPLRSAPSSEAYELNPQRWDHRCLTHEDDARLAAALDVWAAAADLIDCGVPTYGWADLRVQVVPDGFFPGNTVAAGLSFPKVGQQLYVSYCVVQVEEHWVADPLMWLHEVGHCLGLGHSTERLSAMFIGGWWGGPAALDPDDIAGIQAIWGPPRPAFRATYGYWLLAVSSDGGS